MLADSEQVKFGAAFSLARSLPVVLSWTGSFPSREAMVVSTAFLRFVYLDVGEEIQGKCKTVLIGFRW